MTIEMDLSDVRRDYESHGLTRGEMEGRKQAMMAIEAMRRFNPGCENAKLRNFGMTLGIRDTRKIDPTRTRPDGTPDVNDRVEIGPTPPSHPDQTTFIQESSWKRQKR